MLRKWWGQSSSQSGSKKFVTLVYVDAENCKTPPKELMSSIISDNGSKPSETYAYSKWSANSAHTKMYRQAGFRLLQADSGDNNADIMMCLDAYQRVRDLDSNGVKGNVYVCFHGDKGFTHLLEKIRAVNDWNSIWVTSNNNVNPMIENSASRTLKISVSHTKDESVKPSTKKTKSSSANEQKNTSDVEFKEMVLQAIGDGEIRSSKFGNNIIQLQKQNGWKDTGKEAFNTRFGLPKQQKYKVTLSEKLSEFVEVSGEGSFVAYKKKHQVISKRGKVPTEKTSSNELQVNPNQSRGKIDFKEMVLQAIGDGEIKSSKFGINIIQLQKQNGWKDTGKEAFNTRFGLPKQQKYKVTLSEKLSEFVEVSGDGAFVTYKKRLSPESTTQPNYDGNFQRIEGFNSSSKGLRFPLNPRTLAQIFILNAEIEENFDFKERVEVIANKVGVGKVRVFRVLKNLMGLELLNSDSPTEALAGIKLRFETSVDELGEWTTEDINVIRNYFLETQNILDMSE